MEEWYVQPNWNNLLKCYKSRLEIERKKDKKNKKKPLKYGEYFENVVLDYKEGFVIQWLKCSANKPYNIYPRLCKEHWSRKKAASVGQNGRLSASCNFFSFWLIKPWGTTN
jgi:hypothetical protein